MEGYKDLVPAGYEFTYSQRPEYNVGEGQLTAWRKSLFKAVEEHTIYMNIDKSNALYKQNQVCPIVVLRLLSGVPSPTYFVLGNVHISYNTLRGDRKLAECHLVASSLSQLQRYLASQGGKVVTVLCGDFNSTPSSGVFQYLTQGSYDCKLHSPATISGQLEVEVPKEGATAKWYNDAVKKTLYRRSERTKDLAKRHLLWYMTVCNLYVEYEVLRKVLVARYKMDLGLVYSVNERKDALTGLEKRKVRELFSNSLEEIEMLEDSKRNPSNNLLTCIMKSPITFKNAYSEVLRQLCNYIRGYRTSKAESTTYEPLPSIEEVKRKVGTKFNDVELNYEKWEETEEMLKGHTYESGYSHWATELFKCDYIFYSGEGMRPVSVYTIPQFEEVMSEGGICPNNVVPSDHLPVAATFHYAP